MSWPVMFRTILPLSTVFPSKPASAFGTAVQLFFYCLDDEVVGVTGFVGPDDIIDGIT